MAKFNALLNLRLKSKNTQKEKMTALAERSSNGNLSSFSGVFRVSALNESEKTNLEQILKEFRSHDDYDVEQDLNSLMVITSEVRAIINQAVILHGERIKKAQEVLKEYQDGAFTAWLIATYGNRQTPYNFLQYYEFYTSMPQTLHTKIDDMPRQAVYTLASRTGDFSKKEELVRNYKGQPKQELLGMIRTLFPLSETDKRAINYNAQALTCLKRLKSVVDNKNFKPSKKEKERLCEMIKQIQFSIESA